MHEIIEAIKYKNITEAFFGSNGFSIADEVSIKELQLGYGVHPDGSDLSGPNQGVKCQRRVACQSHFQVSVNVGVSPMNLHLK